MPSNNQIILNGCIEQFKIDNELTGTDGELFEIFSLSQIYKSYNPSFEDIESGIVDGGQDGGIDSIITLLNDSTIESTDEVEDITFNNRSQITILISQCKKESSFKESSLDKIITSIPELFDLSKSEDSLLVRFNSELVERALIARSAWKKCSANGGNIRIKLSYAAGADSIEINSVFEDKVNQLLRITRDIFIGGDITYDNYSSSELLRLYQTPRMERVSIEFKESPLSTTFKQGIGYVGMVKLGEYKKFITDSEGLIRDDLFESNIRHFQGNVDVNNKIRSTIISESTETDFWWLNNGITIIATNPSQFSKTLSIESIQIVNGLQTSYSIFNNHNGSFSDERSVLVKVIINEDKAIIDNIIASTNSQTPVTPAILRATDQIQRDLELFYLNSSYYYDRRKNYYKNQGKPGGRIFSIQFAAQAMEAIVYGNPHSARSKPTTLIKDDSNYGRIFNSDLPFGAYLNSCIILRKTIDYHKNISDGFAKNVTSNFKLHISRISTSLLTGSVNYTVDEVAAINSGLYTEELFNRSVRILNEIIQLYSQINPDINLINIAKSKSFVDYMLNELNINI